MMMSLPLGVAPFCKTTNRTELRPLALKPGLNFSWNGILSCGRNVSGIIRNIFLFRSDTLAIWPMESSMDKRNGREMRFVTQGTCFITQGKPIKKYSYCF